MVQVNRNRPVPLLHRVPGPLPRTLQGKPVLHLKKNGDEQFWKKVLAGAVVSVAIVVFWHYANRLFVPAAMACDMQKEILKGACVQSCLRDGTHCGEILDLTGESCLNQDIIPIWGKALPSFGDTCPSKEAFENEPVRPLRLDAIKNLWSQHQRIHPSQTVDLNTRIHAAIGTTPETKGMLSFFNDMFPNVVVVGDIHSKVGQRTLKQFNHFGIKYETKDKVDGSTISPDFWGRVTKEQDIYEHHRDEIRRKLENGLPLSETEQIMLKKLKGVAAVTKLHSEAILDTIQKYKQAVAKLAELSSDHPDRKHWEAEREKYSSIFIFEHNARFGTVLNNGMIEMAPNLDLPKKLAVQLEKVLQALQKEEWEHFSLSILDTFCNWGRGGCSESRSSKNIPGIHALKSDSLLVHPKWGLMMKAFGLSHLAYDDLELWLNDILHNPNREFMPIDDELAEFSAERAKKGHLPQVAAVPNLVICRVPSESFHGMGSHGEMPHIFMNCKCTQYVQNSPYDQEPAL